MNNDDLRAEALRLAVGMSGTGDRDSVIKSARQFYAFLVGADTTKAEPNTAEPNTWGARPLPVAVTVNLPSGNEIEIDGSYVETLASLGPAVEAMIRDGLGSELGETWSSLVIVVAAP